MIRLVARGSREFRLLVHGINYDNITVSANPPGALTPGVAHETMTRAALQKKAQRQKAFRSGRSGLLAAVRAA